jgi:dolichol-phosphate mannosyltransferase
MAQASSIATWVAAGAPGVLSVVIPAYNEAGSLEETVSSLVTALQAAGIKHEILIVNDNSTDETPAVIAALSGRYATVRSVNNSPPNGFGFAVRAGLEAFGGSRFIEGGKVIDYPGHKLILNRMANSFIRILFRQRFNDFTNAFKLYRREVIAGLQPLLSHHFNLTVELPLKALIRGYSFAVVPISWQNRKSGISKLNIREMGSRYLFIVLYCLIEKQLSRGDYRRRH